MKLNGEQTADPARRAVENVNLDDHRRRESDTSNTAVACTACSCIIFARDIARQTAPACMEIKRENLRRLRSMRRLWCPRPASNQSTPSNSTSQRRRRLRPVGDASDRRTQEQYVVCVICSARSWQTERPNMEWPPFDLVLAVSLRGSRITK